MLNLGNRSYATTESSYHCFLGVQTRKHLLRKQDVPEKKTQTSFVPPKHKNVFQKMFLSRANEETFEEMFPRLRGP